MYQVKWRFSSNTFLYGVNTISYKNKMYNLRIRSYNLWMIDKETWNIRTDHGKMGKLIKYNMTAQYHKKFI